MPTEWKIWDEHSTRPKLLRRDGRARNESEGTLPTAGSSRRQVQNIISSARRPPQEQTSVPAWRRHYRRQSCPELCETKQTTARGYAEYLLNTLRSQHVLCEAPAFTPSAAREPTV